MRRVFLPTGFRLITAVALVAATMSFPAVRAQPTGGTDLSFTSLDASGNPLNVRGHLWVPAGPAKGSVVLVHGSSGWTDHREGHHGRALSAAGYAALAIDAFGARGVAGTAEDQARVTAAEMMRDAFAARRLLLEQGFAADRTAIMGFSKGGMVALYAADRNYLPEEKDRFAVSIPFYGSFTYEGKRYAPNDPQMINDMRRSCMRKGASVWTNVRQKRAATRDVIEFLDSAFAK